MEKDKFKIHIPSAAPTVSTEAELKNYKTGALFLKSNGDLYILCRGKEAGRLSLDTFFMKFTSNGLNIDIYKPELCLPVSLAPYGTEITIKQSA